MYENQNQNQIGLSNLGGMIGAVDNAASTRTEDAKYIDVDPIKFESTFEGMVITSTDLSKLISAMFRSSISDYYGCTLEANPTTGGLDFFIYLQEKQGKADGIKTVERTIKEKSSNNIIQDFNNMNKYRSGKTMTLTKDGKEIFEDLMNTHGKKVNWDRVTAEVSEPVGYNRYNIYLRIANISLERIAAKIWGSEEDGSKITYSVAINKFIPGTKNLQILIKRINQENLEKAASDCGLIAGSGNLGIVR